MGDNKKSINTININETDISLDDVVTFIKSNKNNSNIIREINKDISIRIGQYGHYIFYKTTKMTKPKFIKINNFEGDYLTCSTDSILTWLKDKL